MTNDMAHGGKRPGAGRKPIDAEERRVQVCVTISPETKEHLALLSQWEEKRPGAILDHLINKEYNKQSKEHEKE